MQLSLPPPLPGKEDLQRTECFGLQFDAQTFDAKDRGQSPTATFQGPSPFVTLRRACHTRFEDHRHRTSAGWTAMSGFLGMLLRLFSLIACSGGAEAFAFVTAERKWSRAIPGEKAPERAQRLQGHREHQNRQKARRLERLDDLLDSTDEAMRAFGSPMSTPCPSFHVDWKALQPGCDPCSGISSRMGEGTPRGERKRESISAMAHLLDEALKPLESRDQPTVVDCGSGTGSLLLPLAALFPKATFVGVDTKKGSLDRLTLRASAAGPSVSSRVVPWHGRIEDYDGKCDVVLSLHACGGASDAALRLAHERRVPFAVSPCCVGKLRRGPASGWLRGLIAAQAESMDGAASEEPSDGSDDARDPSTVAVDRMFALLAAWADSEHVAAAPIAPSVSRGARIEAGEAQAEAEAATAKATMEHVIASSRRQRCKILVEMDRLMAMDEWRHAEASSRTLPQADDSSPGTTPVGTTAPHVGPARPCPPVTWPSGRLMRITGRAMTSSSQQEVLVGAGAAALPAESER